MKENKKNVITIIVAVTLLLVFVIGLTYALFTFTGKGQRVNQVTTTSVTMSYSEAVNGITLTNAMPISDAAGIVLNDVNQTFEFSVSVVTGSGVSVAWEVAAEKLTVNGEALGNNDVRIYLEKKASTDNNYTAINSPSSFIPEESDSPVGTQAGQMILDQDSATSTVTYNYILRMWVSEGYMLTDTEKSFSVKINVYGKDNYQSASSISLNKNSTTITTGHTETLTVTLTPSGAYNGDITWSSSNTSVATVSSSGVVTGVSEGTAVITAKTRNRKVATCSVTVTDRLWLYKEGDKYISVSGGFEDNKMNIKDVSSWSSRKPVYNTNNIYVAAQNENTVSSSTINKIDVTNYSKLVIDGSVDGYYGMVLILDNYTFASSQNGIQWELIADGYASSRNDTIFTKINGTLTTTTLDPSRSGRKLHQLDISSLSGAYYIGIATISGGAQSSLTVYNIYLEN